MIGNCVGKRNHRFFIVLLFSGLFVCTYGEKEEKRLKCREKEKEIYIYIYIYIEKND